jgi:hypothetical protein
MYRTGSEKVQGYDREHEISLKGTNGSLWDVYITESEEYLQYEARKGTQGRRIEFHTKSRTKQNKPMLIPAVNFDFGQSVSQCYNEITLCKVRYTHTYI